MAFTEIDPSEIKQSPGGGFTEIDPAALDLSNLQRQREALDMMNMSMMMANAPQGRSGPREEKIWGKPQTNARDLWSGLTANATGGSPQAGFEYNELGEVVPKGKLVHQNPNAIPTGQLTAGEMNRLFKRLSTTSPDTQQAQVYQGLSDELTGNKLEDVRRGFTQVLPGAIPGIESLLPMETQKPFTLPGAVIGGISHTAGMVAGPFKAAQAMLPDKIMKAKGLMGEVVRTGSTLGLASGLSELLPAFSKNSDIVDLAEEVGKSAAFGTVTGMLYPAGSFINNKVTRTAVGMAVMDMARGLGSGQGFSTVDDVVKGVANGTISPDELGGLISSYAQDMYFMAKVPHMSKLYEKETGTKLPEVSIKEAALALKNLEGMPLLKEQERFTPGVSRPPFRENKLGLGDTVQETVGSKEPVEFVYPNIVERARVQGATTNEPTIPLGEGPPEGIVRQNAPAIGGRVQGEPIEPLVNREAEMGNKPQITMPITSYSPDAIKPDQTFYAKLPEARSEEPVSPLTFRDQGFERGTTTLGSGPIQTIYEKLSDKLGEKKDETTRIIGAPAGKLYSWLGEQRDKRILTGFIDPHDVKTFQKFFQQPQFAAKTIESMRQAFDTQINRQESRAENIYSDSQQVNGFLKSKDKESLNLTSDFLFSIEGKQVTNANQFIFRDLPDGSVKMESNPAYLKELDALMQKQGLPDNVRADALAVRKTFDEGWVRLHDTLTELHQKGRIDDSDIADMRAELGFIKNYVPHVWYGDYQAKVIDPISGETLHKATAYGPGKTIAGAKLKQVADEMKAQYPDAKLEFSKIKEMPESVFQYPIPVQAIEQVMKSAIKRLPPEMQKGLEKELPEAIADEFKARGFARRGIQRKGVPGYETEDLQRIVMDQITGLNGFISKIKAVEEYSKIMSGLDAKEKPGEYKMTMNYVHDMLRNSDKLDRTVDGFRALAFAKYIAGVPKTGVVNAMQPIITGVPRLSMDMKMAGIEYSKSVKDLTEHFIGTRMGRESNLSPDENAMLDIAYRQGETQAQFIRDLQGKISGHHPIAQKFSNWAGLTMGIPEQMNRYGVLLTAYRAARDGKIINKKRLSEFGLEKGQKADFETAVKYAKVVNTDANFSFGKANRPEALRHGDFSRVAGAAYTFQSFWHSTWGLWRYMAHSDRGLQAIARSFIGMGIIGGAGAIPGFNFLLSLYRQYFGEDPIKASREAIDNKTVSDFLQYGLGGLAQQNISQSVGVGGPIERLDYQTDQPLQDSFLNLIEILGGPPVGMLKDVGKTITDTSKAGIRRGMENAVPNMFKNPAIAYRGLTQGLSTTSGKPISMPGEAEPMKYTWSEAIGRGLGAQPLREAKNRDIMNTIEQMKNYKDSKQQDLANEFANALQKDDEKAMEKVLNETEAWNERMIEEDKPEMIIDLKEAVNSRLRPRGVPKPFVETQEELTQDYFGTEGGQ